MSILKDAIKTGLAVILSLIVLSGFTILYKYTPGRVVNENAPTDFSWTPFGRMSNMQEGFAWFNVDKNGYNNSHAKATGDNPDIVIMGSSHIQGVEVFPEENVGYLLNELLKDKSTYSIGISNHGLLTCVSNIRNTVQVFNTSKYIIIETSSLKLKPEDMELVTEGRYPEIQSNTSGIISFIQTWCPAIKLIAIQYEAWKNSSTNEESPTKSYLTGTDEYYKQLKSLLQYANSEKGESTAKLIIVFNPPTSITSSGDIICEYDPDVLSLFKKACLESDVSFVDLTDDYCRIYNEQHVIAHGFINTTVRSGHLNKYGHQAMAERLAHVIMEDEQ